MSLWIKICANTSLQDAQLAIQAGADAVGFVLAPSPRRITPEQVAEITGKLPAAVEKIGVFVDASLKEIVRSVHLCGLTGVQLHSDSVSELPAQLRRQFHNSLRILRVVHFGPQAAEEAAGIDLDSAVDAILVDSRTAAAVGGTGIAFDWNAARATIFSNKDARARRIVAGGLGPANVAEAIATLRPWGVDVASGVEAAPGRKDPVKVREFVRLARAAAQ